MNLKTYILYIIYLGYKYIFIPSCHQTVLDAKAWVEILSQDWGIVYWHFNVKCLHPFEKIKSNLERIQLWVQNGIYQTSHESPTNNPGRGESREVQIQNPLRLTEGYFLDQKSQQAGRKKRKYMVCNLNGIRR